MSDFQDRGCDVLGISTDSVETHERWLTTTPDQNGLGPIEFPLASDPDGVVCKSYGVYVDRQQLALRGLFIIDPNGVLQYQVVHSLSVGRSSDEVLRVLEALQSGGLCPGEREMGQPTLDVYELLGPNRVFGPYRIESEVGRGGFGTVFRAHDTLLDRTVALKVLRSRDNATSQSLLEEARAAAALNHPNVCAVYSVDTSHGAPSIVMEFVNGQPLSVRLDSGPLSLPLARDLGRQAAAGMAAAHAAGVVHGDLKPANLMITDEGVLKIMDFGLARRDSAGLNTEETLVLPASSSSGLSGTPAYMAPELTRGETATAASDVFALGLVLYEMLVGSPAISGKNVLEVLRRLEQFDGAALAAELPPPFAQIVASALRREPSERAIQMSQIMQALEA